MASSPDSMTPHRSLSVTFDHADTVAVEPAFAVTRNGFEISPGGAGATGSVNVSQLATGGWAIKAAQETHNVITELGDTAGAIVQPSAYTLAPNVVTMPRSRPPSDLPGVTATGFIGGDNFLLPAPPAGANYSDSNLTADATAYPRPSVGTPVPFNRTAVSTSTYPANQAFQFRWDFPTNGVMTPGASHGFYFDNYYLCVFGDGYCTLSQKTGGVWQDRDIWRIGSPNSMRGHHIITITPYTNPLSGVGFIEFKADTSDSAPPLGLATYYAPPTGNRHHIYVVQSLPTVPNPILPPTSGAPRTTATNAGKVRLDMAQNIRMPVQVQLLRYLSPGTLIDLPFFVPFYVTTRENFILKWTATLPTGTSVTAKLYDASTLAECTLVSTGTNSKVYTPNVGSPHYYVVFTLTPSSDHTLTPVLWSYTVQRDGWLATTGLTPFVASGSEIRAYSLRNFSLTGPERDPSHETAAFEFDDLTLAYPALSVRCSQRVRIETTYDSADQTKKSVLFDGYVGRATGRRKTGYLKDGFSGSGNSLYPNPLWKRYEITCAGMWQRLHEALNPTRQNYAIDTSSSAGVDPATNNPLAVKVTDAIRQLISYAGFDPATQIDVPDSAVRFFASSDGNGSQLTLDPLANIAEVVQRFARDYLGWFLCWDGNAGADGMWRLIQPAVPPYTNLAIFRTGAPGAGLVHHSGTYNGSSTSAYVGTSSAPVSTFIRRDTESSYVIPPEGNLLTVTGTGQLIPNGGGALNLTNYAINPQSYNFTSTDTADPTNPDYLGRMVPIVVYDTGLTTNTAVELVTKRIYQLACQAVKMLSFDAPLVLVVDPNDTQQRSPRPLRYYDPVQVVTGGVTSQWLVRNCNPRITKSGYMWAHYELEAPRNVLPGG